MDRCGRLQRRGCRGRGSLHHHIAERTIPAWLPFCVLVSMPRLGDPDPEGQGEQKRGERRRRAAPTGATPEGGYQKQRGKCG